MAISLEAKLPDQAYSIPLGNSGYPRSFSMTLPP
jgi:hypothetical protein